MPLNHAHVLGHRLKRPNTLGLLTAGVLFVSLALLILALHAGSAYAASSIKAADEGGATYQPTPATTPGLRATIADDGRTAIAPAGAPLAVQQAIWAANKIVRKPYIWGGGHSTFKKIARGYDCSGTVSFALGNAGLIKAPMDSSDFMRWGDAGKGAWITVETNPGHAYVYIAGLRLDTSGPGESGPRWRTVKRSDRGFRARHPEGF